MLGSGDAEIIENAVVLGGRAGRREHTDAAIRLAGESPRFLFADGRNQQAEIEDAASLRSCHLNWHECVLTPSEWAADFTLVRASENRRSRCLQWLKQEGDPSWWRFAAACALDPLATRGRGDMRDQDVSARRTRGSAVGEAETRSLLTEPPALPRPAGPRRCPAGCLQSPRELEERDWVVSRGWSGRCRNAVRVTVLRV